MAAHSTNLSDSASPARLKKTNSPFLSRKSQIFEKSTIINQNEGVLTGEFSGTRQRTVSACSNMNSNTDNPRIPSNKVSQLIHSFSQQSLNSKVPVAIVPTGLSARPQNTGSSVTLPPVVQMDNTGPGFGSSCNEVAFDSPSSDSASSISPTSTYSADSWGQQRVVAPSAVTSILPEDDTNSEKKSSAESSPVEASHFLVVPETRVAVPCLNLTPVSPFSPDTLLSAALSHGTAQTGLADTSSNENKVAEIDMVTYVQSTVIEQSTKEKDVKDEALKNDAARSDVAEKSTSVPTTANYQKFIETANVCPKDDDEDDGDESDVEQEDGQNEHGAKISSIIGPAQQQDVKVDIPAKENVVDEELPHQESSDDLGLLEAVQAAADPTDTATATANISRSAATSAQQLAKDWRHHQSTNLLIQRPDGSRIEHVVPHDSFSGSQFLEKRQKRQGSQGRLSSTESLASSSKWNLAQSGVSISSSVRVGSPLAGTSKDSLVFDNQTATMSEDDTPLLPPSRASTNPSLAASLAPQEQSQGTTTSSHSSATASVVLGDGEGTGVSVPYHNHIRRPSKIDTMPLMPGRNRSASNAVLERSRSTTLLSLDDSNLSGPEPVISSKVSRKGKLFAKKIKTIAAFEYNTSKKLGKGNFGIVYQGNRAAATPALSKNASSTLAPAEEAEVAIKKITRKLPGEIEKLGLVQREMKVCRLFKNTVSGKSKIYNIDGFLFLFDEGSPLKPSFSLCKKKKKPQVGVVPLLDIITTSKHHYLVFEKADGDLAEMIRERCNRSGRGNSKDSNLQPLSPSCSLGSILSIDEIRGIMRTVVLGVQALHEEGYSHKDIKPANILHHRQQGLLCDFGLCSRGDDLPRNQFFGTQDYAAPEARRVSNHRTCDYIRSDIYSLGAVLYELATGQVLSRVISQGLNWQKMAQFGGRAFSELVQGMLNDIEKRWNIDQVVKSPFWSNLSIVTPCTPATATATAGARDPSEVALPMNPRTPVKVGRQ